MTDPAKDGVDHINVYSKGRTALGRFLSNFADCNITIDQDGFFRTIEGYWYWLSTRDNRLRRTNGWQSKQLGRKLRGKDWDECENFIAKIKRAIDIKLASNEDMRTLLSKTSLPLKHYYVMYNRIHEPSNGKWILNHLNLYQGRTNATD